MICDTRARFTRTFGIYERGIFSWRIWVNRFPNNTVCIACTSILPCPITGAFIFIFIPIVDDKVYLYRWRDAIYPMRFALPLRLITVPPNSFALTASAEIYDTRSQTKERIFRKLSLIHTTHTNVALTNRSMLSRILREYTSICTFVLSLDCFRILYIYICIYT